MRSRVWRLERQVESSRNMPLLDFTPTTGILVENSYMFWFEPEPRKTQRHSRLWKLSGVHQNLDLLTNVIMQRCSSRCTCWKTHQSHSKNKYCFNQHICGSTNRAYENAWRTQTRATHSELGSTDDMQTYAWGIDQLKDKKDIIIRMNRVCFNSSQDEISARKRIDEHTTGACFHS